ncbi:MAG: transposase [Frankiales bacterium]|nr:transposase [Frankiales bacterium]
MSKRRLVITTVLTGKSQSEVARTYGVSQGWISKLMSRYRLEGETAFRPRSRARKSYENATEPETVELVLRLRKQLHDAGLDAGADTIGWHLTHHHGLSVSRATINRLLTRAGAVTPEPKKRPKSSYLRFEAAQPNETWQSDFTHYRLADGTDTEILTWLDDCSRYALSLTVHRPVTGPIVLDTFRKAAATHGFPASTLTDNGRVFTVRLFAGTPGRNHLEHELRERGITQKNGKPNHPQTQGKVERFQQTLKKWLRAQPVQPPHPRRAAGPPRHVRRDLQRAATAPVPPTPGHPSNDLHHPAQGPPEHRPQPRHPRPSTPRQDRQGRQRDTPRRRPTPAHRRRPNLRPNRRHPAHQ